MTDKIKRGPAPHNRGPRYDAYHEGLPHYNGKPCKNCGTTLKFTSNWSCVTCGTMRVKNRDPKIYKTWAKSEKGRITLATFKKTDTYKAVQKRWEEKPSTRAWRRWHAQERRKLIVDQEKKLTYNEKERIKEIYLECAIKQDNTGDRYEVDHIIPLFEGGEHHPDNLQILTYEEHRKKCGEENTRRCRK